ncbi:MAG: hypothetical protein EPO07_09185 [Verrucomicrobia bacterium]|nr:MAG: hypothetical protein EPO07_09185 [Verrucomicrobiota bacterium]
MKIRCQCGTLIADNTDDLPHKAHLIPDQEWFPVFDAIDAVIADVAAGRSDADSAQTRFRSILGTASRPAYQCRQCGRLFVLDRQNTFFPFAPTEADTDREILRGRDGQVDA